MGLDGTIYVKLDGEDDQNFPFTLEGFRDAAQAFIQGGAAFGFVVSDSDSRKRHDLVIRRVPLEHLGDKVIDAALSTNDHPRVSFVLMSSSDEVMSKLVGVYASLANSEDGGRTDEIPPNVRDFPLRDLFRPKVSDETRACYALRRSASPQPQTLGPVLDFNAKEIKGMRNLGLVGAAVFHRKLKEKGWLQYAKSASLRDHLMPSEQRRYDEIVGQ